MKSSRAPHQKLIRLINYDYSLPGPYFVTICTQGRQFLFGSVIDEEMRLKDAGRIVRQVWEDLPRRFSAVEADLFVVMPNHLHGIISIVGAPLAAPATGGASPAPTLGNIVRAFKSVSAIEINRTLSRADRRLWQRSYYEHVIRDESELDRVRQYVAENPIKWAVDPENPAAESKPVEEPWA